MEDHDQRFKKLVREFFHELFLLFFPQWAEAFDFGQVEWLDKEVFTDLLRGERRAMDLVAKLPTRKGKKRKWLALIHVEVESREKVTALRRRMYEYRHELRRRHNLPVLPIAIYLRVGLDGIGYDVYEESFLGHTFLHFEYAYVGLPALEGLQYLEGENLLGVALSVLMKVPAEQRAELKARALDRVVKSSENAVRKALLWECIDAYLSLEGPALTEYEDLLLTKYPEVRTMAMTTFEKGQVEGRRTLLREQLELRFGPLSPVAVERLAALSAEQLLQLGKTLLTAQSLKELGLEE
ncbi:MAG: DUF4351 domain-containing protein [Gemmataceae bacterium]|nr:DUF4351 domain-containing protein [Gemmataceae bacterium]